jgi:hypothetical protein
MDRRLSNERDPALVPLDGLDLGAGPETPTRWVVHITQRS